MLPLADDAPDRFDDLQATPSHRARGRTGLVAKLVLSAALIAGLSLIARDRAAAPEPQRAWSEPPRAAEGARRAIAATEPLLSLRDDAAELAPQIEPTRWNSGNGQHEDGVSQGAFDRIEAPYLLVTATDAGGRSESGSSLFVTLGRELITAARLSGCVVGPSGLEDHEWRGLT